MIGNVTVGFAIPSQVIFIIKAFRTTDDPSLMRKYIFRSLSFTTLAMGFFMYTTLKHIKMEQ